MNAASPVTICIAGPAGCGKSALLDRFVLEFASTVDTSAGAGERARGRQGEPMTGSAPDAARAHVKTPHGEFLMAETAGQRDMLHALVSGAAGGFAAFLVVDAQSGAAPDADRLLASLRLLGVREIVVAVNKMDRVRWSEERFAAVRDAVAEAAGRLDLRARAVVPVCARDGANLRLRAPEASWWNGPTLVEALEALHAPARVAGGPLRLPVHEVVRKDGLSIATGRVESGSLAAGDEVLILPSNRTAIIARLAGEPSPAMAATGDEASVVLGSGAEVERGDLLCSPDAPPKLTSVFDADVLWLGSGGLASGRRLALRLGPREVDARISAVHTVLDAGTGARRAAPSAAEGEIARVSVRCDAAVAVDDAWALPATGRFALVDGGLLAGAGVIDATGYPDQRRARHHLSDVVPVRHQIATPERDARSGHTGAVVWLTGLSGAGKSTLALALERRLFDRGWNAYTLDGDNVRTGLSADLGFSPADRQENLRRIGEVAALFADAGMICVTAFISPYRDERARAREATGARPFIEVWVRSALETCEKRDPKGLYAKARAGAIKGFTGIDSPYEPPESADLVIDTEALDVEASIALLVEHVVATCRKP